MRRAIGATLFFGSWVIYGIMIFIAADTEWTVAEKVGIGAMLYGISWVTFVSGSILLGPEFIEKIKQTIKPKNKNINVKITLYTIAPAGKKNIRIGCRCHSTLNSSLHAPIANAVASVRSKCNSPAFSFFSIVTFSSPSFAGAASSVAFSSFLAGAASASGSEI